MKNRKTYIARSTATLTQSGLLAALLQHQRRKVIELSHRRAQNEQVRGLLRNSLTWLLARYQNMTASRRFRRGFAGETIPKHT
jgi:predicted metal-dependent hydrolase